MKYLEDMILKYGEVAEGNILKVDSFLNHRMDPQVYSEIGKEFLRLFGDCGVNKILTIEASGIGIAAVTAQYFVVPAVFAKKSKTGNIGDDLYSATVYSYTHGNSANIVVSKKYLSQDDRVLIIDDFLANGQALLGLRSIVKQAGAELIGCGVVIEKGFQEGGWILREMGVRVESLAIIESMSDNAIVFREQL
jgi:xanthine phosphoribosyltransferase